MKIATSTVRIALQPPRVPALRQEDRTGPTAPPFGAAATTDTSASGDRDRRRGFRAMCFSPVAVTPQRDHEMIAGKPFAVEHEHQLLGIVEPTFPEPRNS
jgi:hypothetical protein